MSDVEDSVAKVLRAAIYARVSTRKDEQRRALESSVGRLRDYCRARGFGVSDEHVLTDMLSGGDSTRPSYQRMRDLVRARGVDVVVATKLDRVARSTRELLAFADELQTHGVELILLDQSIDTGTPAGRLLFTVIAAVAEFERELIRDRVRRGMDRAREKGVTFGRARSHGDLLARVRALRPHHSLNDLVRILGEEGRPVTRSWVRRACVGTPLEVRGGTGGGSEPPVFGPQNTPLHNQTSPGGTAP